MATTAMATTQTATPTPIPTAAPEERPLPPAVASSSFLSFSSADAVSPAGAPEVSDAAVDSDVAKAS